MLQEHVVKDSNVLRRILRETISRVFSLNTYNYSENDLIKYIEDFCLPSFISFYYQSNYSDFEKYLNSIEKVNTNYLAIFNRVDLLLSDLKKTNSFNRNDNCRILGDVHPNGSTKILSNNVVKYFQYPNYSEILEKVTQLILDDWDNYLPKINKSTDGYITREYIDRLENTNSEVVVEEFYYNLGRFIPILLLLRTIDINAENMLIRLPYPIFFDMETIISGIFEENFLEYDLKNTGVIKVSNNMDSSLLTGGTEKITSYLKPIIIGDKTKPSVVWKIKSNGKYHNTPFFNGRKVDISLYFEYLLRGYRESYKEIISKKSDILDIKLYEKNYVRVLIHPTRVYRVITLQSCYPEIYTNENIKIFMRKKLKEYNFIHKVSDVNILNTEVESMLKLQIPVFYCDINSKAVISSSGSIVGYYNISPYDYWMRFVKEVVTKEFFIEQENLLLSSIPPFS